MALGGRYQMPRVVPTRSLPVQRRATGCGPQSPRQVNHGTEMDAEKIDWLVRNIVIWGIGGIAVILAAQRFLF